MGSSDARQAVEQLFLEHGHRIYALGLHLGEKPEDADELVQETFLRALRKWSQFEGRAAPSTWLHRAGRCLRRALPAPGRQADQARRMCLDLLRGKQEALDRGRSFPLDDLCDRCRALFQSLDLGMAACRTLRRGGLPGRLRRMLEPDAHRASASPARRSPAARSAADRRILRREPSGPDVAPTIGGGATCGPRCR